MSGDSILESIERFLTPPRWDSDPDALRVHRRLLETTQRNLERPWSLVKDGEVLGYSTTGGDLVELKTILGGEIVYTAPAQS